MNRSQYLILKKVILELLLAEKVKEYSCHIQFVSKIAISFARQLQVDEKTVEIASLLHDIGRDKEKGNEAHEETGARIAEEIIDETVPDLPEKEIILNCIQHHNHRVSNCSLEEKIIASADGASKVIYHQAFMLMCKKEGFIDRAEWGMKYLRKGMNSIQIASLRKEAIPFYREYIKIYQKVLLQVSQRL